MKLYNNRIPVKSRCGLGDPPAAETGIRRKSLLLAACRNLGEPNRSLPDPRTIRTEPQTRLATALADRYRIERELGQRGMATVYLAEYLKHHRKVAVKVLRPELAAMIGAERFLAEISTSIEVRSKPG